MIYKEIAFRNRTGKCIRTGLRECNWSGTDKKCFRCLDPKTADRMLNEALYKEELPRNKE